MKNNKSKKTFDKISPIGMAGINKSFRKDEISFSVINLNVIDRIQNFYQEVLQSLKA